MDLRDVERWVPAARRRGVSVVARGPRGFLAAYRAAGGDPSRLTEAWRRKRAGFVARHAGQMAARGEPVRGRDGAPTRRALALVMWAYDPGL